MTVTTPDQKPKPMAFSATLPQPYTTEDGRSFKMKSSAGAASGGALAVPAFYSGVRFISEVAAGLPKKIFRKEGRNRLPVDGHPLATLLSEQPNPLVNAFYFWETIVGHAVIYGNGYGWINRNLDGTPSALFGLHPFLVKPFRRDGQQFYRLRDWTGAAVNDSDTGQPIEIEAADMLHLRNWSEDGEVGVSVIELLADTFGIARSLDQFLASFFENGAITNLAVEAEKGSTPQDIDTLRYAIESNNVGRSNAHNIMVVAGAAVKNLTAPLKDFSYDILKPASLDDIARVLRVPPTTLYALGRATWSNLEQLGVELVKFSLGSWVIKLELECNIKLLTKSERAAGNYIKWNIDGLQRGDYASRVEAGVKLTTNRLMRPNEWRALEDLEPYDGGDEFYGPLNTPAVNDTVNTLDVAKMTAIADLSEKVLAGTLPRATAVNLVAKFMGTEVADAEQLVAPAAAPADPTPEPPAPSDAAFSRIFSHIADRVRTKQAKAFANNKRTGDEHESWLADFATKQGLMLAEELDPALGLFGRDVTEVSFALQTAVESYTADVLHAGAAADPQDTINKVISKLKGNQ